MSDLPELHLVRVIMTDFIVADSPVPLIWIAAVPRDNAAEAVARVIPANWLAEVMDDPVSSRLRALIKLAPGEVSELSRARK